jgi:hypothetical protein
VALLFKTGAEEAAHRPVVVNHEEFLRLATWASSRPALD